MSETALRIEVPNIVTNAEVSITYKEEKLFFTVSCYGRKSFQEFDVFEQMNDYWATLPDYRQSEIFEIYRAINLCFESIHGREELYKAVRDECTKLLDAHDIEDISTWINFKSKIIIPDKFEREYVHSIDRQGSREQTYIRSDYTRLVVLSLVLRVMVPVWGEYIAHTRQQYGTTFKEYQAFMLIVKSKLFNCDAMEKLRVYIDATVQDDRYNATNIIEGINSEDFPAYILGLVLIRRLCTGDMRGLDPKANLVTLVHKFVVHRGSGTDVAVDSMVKDKRPEEAESGMESKLSTLERYKNKHELAIGDICELEHAVSNPVQLAFQLSANMTEFLIQRSLYTAQELVANRLSAPQIMLMRLIIAPIISPRGVMYLKKQTIVNLLGVTQAVLWARGHKYLSVLSTCYASLNDNEIHITSSDSRGRVSKDQLAELDRLYPYPKITGGRRTGVKPINLVVRDLDAIADDLSLYSWIATIDDDLRGEVIDSTGSRRIPIPYDIKSLLANLFIEIGNRNWV